MTERLIVLQNNERTKWMQAADVFEKFKIIGEILILPFLGTPSKESTEKMLENMNTLAKEGGVDGQPDLSCVGILFPSYPEACYLDPKVKVVSDGRKWVMIKTVLEHFNPEFDFKAAGIDPYVS